MTQDQINVAIDNFYGTGKIQAVGVRYGDAPESGMSFNTASNQYEAGVSMLQVNDLPGVLSFAVAAARSRKLRYYIGTVINTTGGDNELLMVDVKSISRAEYNKFTKSAQGKLASLVLSFWRMDKMGQIGVADAHPAIYQPWVDTYNQKLKEVSSR